MASGAVLERLDEALAHGLEPDPLESLADWSDQHIDLPIGLTAEGGRYRTDRTPYLREILDHLGPSSAVEEVVVVKGSQLGFTQAGINWIGYIIARVPGPVLVVEPTVDVGQKLSKLRIRPMLDSTRALQGKVRDPRERDSGNTILMKEFDGGVLVLTGANSGIGLRFLSARYLMLDEEDAYPQDVDREGHPSELAKKRTTSFSRRKIYRLSTPLEDTTSVIWPAYLRGSQARYHVPCPFCGHRQYFQWARFQFTFNGTPDPSRVRYQCEGCQDLIPESAKATMLPNGTWVHQYPEREIKSYHLTGFYAPYGWKPVSWPALVQQFLEAHSASERGDTRLLRIFINHVLAETWQDKGQSLEGEGLQNRCEVYEAPVPRGGLLLTAAVDLQEDRAEGEVCAWGLGEECWSVDYHVWEGSPADPELWQRIDEWLQQGWRTADGVILKVRRGLVDTGGHHTQEAYEFVRPRQRRGIFGIKGSSQRAQPLIKRGERINGVRIYLIGTDTAKDTLFQRLMLEQPGPGYLHFPDRPEYQEQYFAGLTAEERKEKWHRGVLLGWCYKKKPGQRRNEPLDLKVYNLAALKLLNPNLEQLAASWPQVVARAQTVTAAGGAAAGPAGGEPIRRTRRILDPGLRE